MFFNILSKFFGWIIGIASTSLLYVFEFLAKKLGVSTLILAFKISISAVFLTFIMAAFYFILDFIFWILNLFKDLISSLATVPTVGGNSFGISNNTLINSFFGFLHESGMADAFVAAGDLFIGLVSVFMIIQTYKLVIFAKKEVHNIITTILTLMQR